MSAGAVEGRPSVLEGIVAAMVASVAGAALAAALAPLLGADAALRAAVAAVAAGYALYLLARSAERVGRVTTGASWLLLSAGAWLAGVPLAAYLLLHVAMLSLVRSLYFRSGVLPALADLALSGLGAAFAAWAAARSGSALLALWCFFLVQALAALLPSSIASPAKEPAPPTVDSFDRARYAAESALRRLAAERR